MKRAWIRVAHVVLSAGFVASLGLAMSTEINYSIVMPKAPDPATGRVHRLVVNHGYVIFVNDDERRYKSETEYLFLAGICAMMVAIYLNVTYDVFPAIRPIRRWRN